MAATFYGKIKARGDFVRINLGEAFDLPQWLEATLEAIKKQRLTLPEATFLYLKAGAKKVLFGITAPSTDSVGRVSPLALFLTLDASEAVRSYAQLPQHALVPAALDLARNCHGMTIEALEAAVAALPTTGRAPLPVAAPSLPPASTPAPSGGLASVTVNLPPSMTTTPPAAPSASAPAVSAGAPLASATPENRYYAFRTFALACQQGAASPDSGIMVDCPIAAPSDIPFWLELTLRLMKSPAVPPGFFVTPNRLLITLSEVSPLILSLLAKPENQNAKLWPLLSSNARALESAKTALSATQRMAIDTAETPAALAEVFP